MRNWTSEEKRYELWNLFYKNTEDRLNILQKLREKRHELAILLGYESFADLKAQSSMLGSVESIDEYLVNLSDNIYLDCLKESIKLKTLKDKVCENKISDKLNLWDMIIVKRLTYLELKHKNEKLSAFDRQIGSYLTMDTVKWSLIRIMDYFFDLTMEQTNLDDNESWLKPEIIPPINDENKENNDTDTINCNNESENIEEIMKFYIKKKVTNEIIGILYLDLYERDNKNLEAVTYPLCCSKNMDNILNFDIEIDNDSGITHDRYDEILGFESINGGNNSRQIPSVILSMNFDKNLDILSHQQLIALYHEFGHCLHYLLSNTQYQTLSGPRGLCFEFLEFTSTLFENIGFDCNFIKYAIIDNDYDNECITQDILNIIKEPNYKSVHMMQQICDARFDLKLFNKNQNQSIDDIIKDVYKPLFHCMMCNNNLDINNYDINEMDIYSQKQKLSRFYHFIDYPSNYYTYIIAEQISKNIWNNTFKYDSINNNNNEINYQFKSWQNHIRKYGKQLYDTILTKGCTINPIKCLNNFAGQQIVNKILFKENKKNRIETKNF